MKNSSRFSMWFHRPVRIKYSNNWLTNVLKFKTVSVWLIIKENSLSQLHRHKFMKPSVYDLKICTYSDFEFSFFYIFLDTAWYALLFRTSKISCWPSRLKTTVTNDTKGKHVQKKCKYCRYLSLHVPFSTSSNPRAAIYCGGKSSSGSSEFEFNLVYCVRNPDISLTACWTAGVKVTLFWHVPSSPSSHS